MSNLALMAIGGELFDDLDEVNELPFCDELLNILKN